jgi:hypothetical protein
MVCVRETFSTTSDTRFAAANQRCTLTPPDLRFPIVELRSDPARFRMEPGVSVASHCDSVHCHVENSPALRKREIVQRSLVEQKTVTRYAFHA